MSRKRAKQLLESKLCRFLATTLMTKLNKVIALLVIEKIKY
jgi:hypothetical protein